MSELVGAEAVVEQQQIENQSQPPLLETGEAEEEEEASASENNATEVDNSLVDMAGDAPAEDPEVLAASELGDKSEQAAIHEDESTTSLQLDVTDEDAVVIDDETRVETSDVKDELSAGDTTDGLEENAAPDDVSTTLVAYIKSI